MDLFTYLMSKNEKYLSIHGDLFSYLLGKSQSGGEIKTVSGITITIPDAKKTNLVSFMMTKESTQVGTPTPDNPQEVNVVEGYRNLFDKNNFNSVNNIYINLSSNIYSSGSSGIKTLYISIPAEVKKYTITKLSSNVFRVATSPNIPEVNGTISSRVIINAGTKITITSTINDNYLAVSYYQSTTDTLTEQEILDSIMIIEGDQQLPYVPYGNNYIAVNVSDGTTTNKYPIPLNNNIIAGIGDYKDELLVDKNGNVFINKKTGKIILDGSQNWSGATASDGKRFTCNAIKELVKIPESTSTIVDIICDRFISESANDTNSSINGIAIAGSGNIIVYYDVIKNYGNTQAKQWFALNITTLYYALETPELIDLQTTVDINLFKGANTITNSEDGYMTIEYQ